MFFLYFTVHIPMGCMFLHSKYATSGTFYIPALIPSPLVHFITSECLGKSLVDESSLSGPPIIGFHRDIVPEVFQRK